MRKQLLIIILFTILIFGVYSEEKNILGKWETIVYDELLEMTFEKDTVTARIYQNSCDDDSDIFEEEKVNFGIIGDLIVIDNDIYNYLLIDNRLLLLGGSDMIMLKRKKESPLFTKDMLIGKWSAKKDDGMTVELLFDNNNTVTTTVYEDEKLQDTTVVPFELKDKYIKMDDTYYLFKAESGKLLFFKDNMIYKKQ